MKEKIASAIILLLALTIWLFPIPVSRAISQETGVEVYDSDNNLWVRYPASDVRVKRYDFTVLNSVSNTDTFDYGDLQDMYCSGYVWFESTGTGDKNVVLQLGDVDGDGFYNATSIHTVDMTNATSFKLDFDNRCGHSARIHVETTGTTIGINNTVTAHIAIYRK